MSEPTPTIEAPKRRGPVVAAALAVAVIIAAVAVFFATRGDDGDGEGATAGAGDPVRIGVVGASDPYWEVFKDAAADEGIEVEIQDFTDYAQPNPALAEGELDLNQFQHIVYLADYNVSNDQDLTPIGSTAIYPLGLHSKKYDAVDEIPDGSTVAVPNDVSNQARALVVLQSAGLIELKDGGTIFSDLNDVDTGASRVEVAALDANATPASLDDVAAAVINNDFVERAGLEFDDALAQDDPSDPNALPYVNIFAARAEDKDDATYQKLVEIFQNTKAVTDGLQEVSGGTAQLVKTPVADLEASLEKTEQETADQK